MKSFIDYIEDTFQGVEDDGTLYRYKRLVLERMTRAPTRSRTRGFGTNRF